MEAKEIKALRESLGISQQEMSTRLGVSLMTISRWERGISIPSNLAGEKLQALKAKTERKSK
jgi:DNA-binding transcriptional regulator YiaG